MKLHPQQIVHSGWGCDKIGLKRVLIQVIVGSLSGLVWTASLFLNYFHSSVSLVFGLQIHECREGLMCVVVE